jgi:arginase family enzyme
MIDIGKKMMRHMIVETTHKEPNKEIIISYIIGGEHHVCHPTMRKFILFIW